MTGHSGDFEWIKNDIICMLQRLPAEIRVQIYYYCLTDDMFGNPMDLHPRDPARPIHNLLQLSPAFSREVQLSVRPRFPVSVTLKTDDWTPAEAESVLFCLDRETNLWLFKGLGEITSLEWHRPDGEDFVDVEVRRDSHGHITVWIDTHDLVWNFADERLPRLAESVRVSIARRRGHGITIPELYILSDLFVEASWYVPALEDYERTPLARLDHWRAVKGDLQRRDEQHASDVQKKKGRHSV